MPLPELDPVPDDEPVALDVVLVEVDVADVLEEDAVVVALDEATNPVDDDWVVVEAVPAPPIPSWQSEVVHATP